MRITNWKHFPWFVFVLLATIAACILYIGNFHPHLMPAGIRLPASLIQKTTEHHTIGGTPLGLAFGAISLGIFVFAALLSLRKKIPLWRIGTVQRWLRAHIWLTFLTIPLVILHSGFRLGGSMTTLLMLLYAIVMVSGIYGLVLQNYIPRLMKERLPAETVFEQIPHIRYQLCVAAEKMRDSFKPAPPKKAEGAAPVAAKAAATASAVMAATKGELSTPTARPKSATGSALTAAPVTGATTSSATPASKEEATAEGSESGHGPPASAVLRHGRQAAETAAETRSEVSGRSSDAPNEEASAKAAPANAGPPAESKPADTVIAPATQEEKKPPTKPAAPPTAAKPATPASKPAAAPVAKPAAAPKPAVATDPASEAMLVEFIDRQILPYLRTRRGERFRFGKARFSDDTFRFVKLGVSEAYRSRVEEIQGWCDERRLLDLQTRLHHWLHGWLIIHVPFSFLLLMLTIWHACVTLVNY